MTTTVTDAVAKRDNSPAAMIRTYSADFASVLPSHVKADTWVRLAQGALKKGKRLPSGRFELEEAAANNPGVFLAALLDAARLGLEPGTELYYLTPRKVKGRLEILGIVGYQGHIELMYRAGAISSVVAEVVREYDTYEFMPGQLDRQIPPRWDGPQEIPWHKYPNFAGSSTRGRLIGVYAYGRMKGGGAISKVVQLGLDDIARIKQSSQGSDSEYSPWRNHEEAMWLKSAVRQLQKWVPTSAEFRREELRAQAEAARITEERELPPPPAEAEFVEGEVVGEKDWPVTSTPPDAA